MSPMPTCAVLYCTCHETLSSTLPPDLLGRCCPDVLFAQGRCLCTLEGCKEALEGLALPQGLPVVLGACSRLAKGDLAATLVRQVTGSPVLLADLREGCVWCAENEATPNLVFKAVDMLCMAMARLPACTPATPATPEARSFLPGNPLSEARVAIIGAGPAGLAASATLVDAGIKVTLIERRPTVGGLLNQVGRLFPENTPTEDLLAPLRREHPLLDCCLKTAVTDIARSGAGFVLTLKEGSEVRTLNADAVVLATGSQPVLPQSRFRAKEVKGVISQMEFETRLTAAEAGKGGDLPANLVCIQCVAAREPEAPYCSAICCPTALKNALRLLALRPDASVTIAHRNMVTPGALPEQLYRKAMAAGVRFVRFTPDAPPIVEGEGLACGVTVTLEQGESLYLPADLVVCSTPLRPTPDTAPLARRLGVRLDDMGFVCGREPLFPLEPAVPGVTLCGAARWPVYASQAVDQGRAAALKILLQLKDRAEQVACTLPDGTACGAEATVTADKCSVCGRCALACPYGACAVESKRLVINEALCRRCGSCTAVCPTGAISLPDEPFAISRAMIREAMGDHRAFQRRSA